MRVLELDKWSGVKTPNHFRESKIYNMSINLSID